MKRLLLIVGRFFTGAAKLPEDTHEFGFMAALWLWYLYVLPSKKGGKYIGFMTKYMDKQFSPVTAQFESDTYDKDFHIPEPHITPEKKPIWVCWLQGEENMPELVKMCYGYLKKNKPDYAEIHLLTIDNYKDYITLPAFIEDKFNNGQITRIHFTDLLRVHLLYAYGGLWIDSTVYTSRTLPDEFFISRFYGQKMSDPFKYSYEPSRAQWSGFLMGGEQGNPLLCYLRNTLWHYWQEHNDLVEYLILDYCIITAYNHFQKFKDEIDAIKPNNEALWEMWNSIEMKYDEQLYKKLVSDTTFFKLSYKKELRMFTDTGEPTFYKHLKDNI